MEYLAGTSQTRLTNNAGGNSQPSWSADGTKIVFSSGRDGNAEIYVMDANGANQTRLTTRPTGSDTAPRSAPDGSKIAFVSVERWHQRHLGHGRRRQRTAVDVTQRPRRRPARRRGHPTAPRSRSRSTPHRQPRDLRDERRRRIADEPHEHRRLRGHARLVTRRHPASSMRRTGCATMNADGSNQVPRRRDLEPRHCAELGRQRRGPRVHDRPRLQRRDLPHSDRRVLRLPQRLTNNAPPGNLVPADTAPEWQTPPGRCAEHPRRVPPAAAQAASSTPASAPAAGSGSSVRARPCRCRSTGRGSVPASGVGASRAQRDGDRTDGCELPHHLAVGLHRGRRCRTSTIVAGADGAQPRHDRASSERQGQRLQQLRARSTSSSTSWASTPTRRGRARQSVPRGDADAPLRHPIGARRRAATSR